MTIKFLQAVSIEVPLDPSSGGTGFDNGSFTLQLGGNTIISNGGSIVLGGFTVTILESAAAVLNDNTATAGHVGFFSNAYKLDDDSEFFWDNTSKRLGVGNSAPAEKLHVTGVGRFSTGLHLDYMDAQAIPYMSASTDRLVGNGTMFYYDDTNDVVHIGGSSTITGTPKIAIKGTENDSTTGPHFAAYTSSDIYPLMQALNYTHDNVCISFDAYYNGSWRSADAGSNFQIRKNSDRFGIWYSNGIAQGSVLTWEEATRIGTTGVFNAVKGIIANLAGTGIIKMNSITVANAAVAQVALEAAPNALIFVLDATRHAIYSLRGAANTTAEIADPVAVFTPTAGTAASTNIYWSAGNSRYELQNNTGATRTYAILIFQI